MTHRGKPYSRSILTDMSKSCPSIVGSLGSWYPQQKSIIPPPHWTQVCLFDVTTVLYRQYQVTRMGSPSPCAAPRDAPPNINHRFGSSSLCKLRHTHTHNHIDYCYRISLISAVRAQTLRLKIPMRTFPFKPHQARGSITCCAARTHKRMGRYSGAGGGLYKAPPLPSFR